MSVQLLDKTRKINKLLHNSSSSKVVFNDICQVLMETLSSNILVLSKKGKVLGVSLCPGVEEITELIEDKVGGYVDSLLNERFLGVLSTKENVNLQTLGFEHVSSSYQGIINPIDIAGERRKQCLHKIYICHFIPFWINSLCFFHKQLFLSLQFQPFFWRNIRICKFFIFQIFLCK